MIKVAILSISMLTVMSGAAVAPALADIIAAFPGSPETSGKIVLTTPALTIIPMALLTGVLSRSFSRKKLIYAGLFFYVTGGAGGGLAESITFLLVMRGLLGIGVGLLMPVSTGVIADIYEGEEKVRTMGYAGAASNLGGIVATLLSGFLAVYSWRASFTVYLLGLIVVVLTFKYIPDNKVKDNRAIVHVRGGDYAVYILWGLAMFLVMAVFYAIPVNIALYLSKFDLGNAGVSGIIISFLTASSFVTGIFFGRLKSKIGSWLPTLGILSSAFGFYLLAEFASIYATIAAMATAGFSIGCLVPYIMTGVTQQSKNGGATSGTAVVSSFLFAGQFASPLLTENAARLITGEGIPAVFKMLSICLTAFGLIHIIYQIVTKIFIKTKEEGYEN